MLQVNDILRTLESKFVPVVRAVIQRPLDEITRTRRHSIHYKVEDDVAVHLYVTYDHKLGLGQNEMFLLHVKLIGGPVSLLELQEIGTALSKFWTWDTDAVEINGYDFTLGDGDDSGAVQFKNGEFTIWLRGWKD